MKTLEDKIRKVVESHEKKTGEKIYVINYELRKPLGFNTKPEAKVTITK